MIQTISLAPGVTLRCCTDRRFKQGRLSLQLVRPMYRQEAAMNSLLGSVLLRGTGRHPDIRSITAYLDDLYGASVGELVRRIGDYHTTGLYTSFMEDRFAMAGDEILSPMVKFLEELLLEPILTGDGFCPEFVESEKKNLIAELESERNDKSVYAGSQLLRLMCSADSFGIPRLGDKEQILAITPQSLYRHYRKVLTESPVELFYVGSREPEQIGTLLMPLVSGLARKVSPLPAQTAFHDGGKTVRREKMDISQSRLCMGFVTPITNRDPRFAAAQVMNTLFGAGMTSKLFQNVREKQSLCYSIGSSYYGSKGIVTVGAGIDADKETVTREEILRQLECCRQGQITPLELTAARESILSGLRTIHDSPGAIEGYYATAALSGLGMDLQGYRRAVEQVTAEQVTEAACLLDLHSEFFLEGAGA